MSIISQFAGGGVKSVQSGVSTVAGAITVTTVDTTKAVVYSVSKGSAGTVAARGTVASTGTLTAQIGPMGTDQGGLVPWIGGSYVWPITNGQTTSSGTISGGTTDLTTKQYSARLTSATTLTVDGPCEWQIVEYY